ncbi:hypothetical protein C7M84_004851 [Penaeus vannamei]|uniref:Uncharacterized protein n=1 Tax=Penaeus vannamei TaxID=6689 RepID=A0A3R7PTF2_PENVA|nr:hypothetical protein C7M84_004851 [Penaeus vannamei]
MAENSGLKGNEKQLQKKPHMAQHHKNRERSRNVAQPLVSYVEIPKVGARRVFTGKERPEWRRARPGNYAPCARRTRSASALNLALGEASSPDYTHRPPVRHQLSLPDSSPILTAHERTLRNLMAAHRADFPEGGAVGGVGKLDASSDPCRFEYHAAQLEKFLMEYRSLQEQLYRMKESYEAQQRAGSLSRIDTIPESGGGALDESPPPPAGGLVHQQATPLRPRGPRYPAREYPECRGAPQVHPQEEVRRGGARTPEPLLQKCLLRGRPTPALRGAVLRRARRRAEAVPGA